MFIKIKEVRYNKRQIVSYNPYFDEARMGTHCVAVITTEARDPEVTTCDVHKYGSEQDRDAALAALDRIFDVHEI